jgi:uncharacterized membrane protein YoaK (UPF0700 family)
MLTARAYSFRQKSKLAISLSWIGGYTNVVLFLACGAFVSHMTGNSTQFGLALIERDGTHLLHFGFLLLCFWLGAVSSAFMTESAQRRGVRSKYILPMAAEGALLSTLAILLNYQNVTGRHDAGLYNAMAFLAAFAMGLQNATITEISGAVIRTTHLTGVITDFGLEGVRYLNWYLDRTRGRRWQRSGRVLRISQRHPSAQRLGLLFCVFWSFIFGAVAGGWMHFIYAGTALIPPVAFILWIIVMDWRKPMAGVKELDLLSDPELSAYGIVKSLLPAELGLFRLTPHHAGRSHVPPDFQQWVDLLPHRWRVIILALSPLTHFNENSAMGLREVIRRLRDEEHRTLIIAGITAAQYKVLVHHGLLEVTDSENLCPDLEFAIARGIDLLRHPFRAPSSELTAAAASA